VLTPSEIKILLLSQEIKKKLKSINIESICLVIN
jgi:hypothetical protein